MTVVDKMSQAAFLREQEAFERLKPGLLAEHRGKYVVIHDGKVFAIGDNEMELIERAYDELGYVPLYVGLIEDQEPVVRVLSPRIVRGSQ